VASRCDRFAEDLFALPLLAIPLPAPARLGVDEGDWANACITNCGSWAMTIRSARAAASGLRRPDYQCRIASTDRPKASAKRPWLKRSRFLMAQVGRFEKRHLVALALAFHIGACLRRAMRNLVKQFAYFPRRPFAYPDHMHWHTRAGTTSTVPPERTPFDRQQPPPDQVSSECNQPRATNPHATKELCHP